MLNYMMKNCPACGLTMKCFNIGTAPACDKCADTAKKLKIGIKKYVQMTHNINKQTGRKAIISVI